MEINITPEIVRELLHYNPDTGIFTWRERGEQWFQDRRAWKIWNARFADQRAGSVRTYRGTGYQCRKIGLLGRRHLEHHLAWLYMTDDPLPEQIDHESRDATDNKWVNLRASTNAQNGRNRSMHRTNTSGVTGVCWDKMRGKWKAMCRASGKLYHLGRFDEIDEAAMEVMEFRVERSFDPKHGLDVAHYYEAVGSQGVPA